VSPALAGRRIIGHQERHKAEPLRRVQFLFGIEDSLDALAQGTLANRKSLGVVITTALAGPFQIVDVAVNEMAENNPHSLKNT